MVKMAVFAKSLWQERIDIIFPAASGIVQEGGGREEIRLENCIDIYVAYCYIVAQLDNIS
jgi:hypothetical protein